MGLERLAVSGFRNLAPTELAPGEGVNVLVGPNAAGKTSLLEALYVLGRGRSFRSSGLDEAIQWGAEGFSVHGRVAGVSLGVGRAPGVTRARLGGRAVEGLAALARRLPVQVINNEHQRLLLDGPRIRRSFLNWGTFHVEPAYHEAWRRYGRALRQRNAALRRADLALARAWSTEVSAAGEAIDGARRRFLAGLEAAMLEYLEPWLSGTTVELRYRRGWSQESPLAEALEQAAAREREVGHTLHGPHRAELEIRAAGGLARERLSRGQQKLLVLALLLAQLRVWTEHAEAMPVLLIDDVAAELDGERRRWVMEAIGAQRCQAFVTAVDAAGLPGLEEAVMFHVERGKVGAVV